MLRYATSVYGQEVLLGASWSSIWWFIGAGLTFIMVHAVWMALSGVGPRPAGR